MTDYSPNKSPKGSVWVCIRCGRYNKLRSALHSYTMNEEGKFDAGCNCAPTPGGFDVLAEASTLSKDEHGRVTDFSHWYRWNVER